MITVDEALGRVLANTRALGPVTVPLLDSVGGVLAEPVLSDVDLPPFNRSAMDGYAVRAEDVRNVPVELEVIETIPAGATPSEAIGPGRCAKVMTGAPCPDGADVVVRVEYTESSGAASAADSGRVRILRQDSGTNICLRGEDIRRGEQVLAAGKPIRPAEVALLATVGRVRVSIIRRPTVAVLSTGDELVEPDRPMGPAKIRDSNRYCLSSQVRRAGFTARDLGIARDRPEELREKIRQGLSEDVLILSGGVSMGDYDYVPQILEEMDVAVQFSEVAMKPGKPTVFATHADGLVFGLPGNPVSSFLTFRLFVLPALKRMSGDPGPANSYASATLAETLTKRKGRQTYVPALAKEEAEGAIARPVPFHGSGDLVGLCKSNAVIVFPAQAEKLPAGETVEVMWIDD